MSVNLHATTSAVTSRAATYVWGPDLGSRGDARGDWQRAGGVGGLLMVLGTATATDYFPLHDRMGNIVGYRRADVSPNAATDHNRLSQYGAVYDYDAFGRETRSAGPAADSIPFHFSSKFTDAETGLNYYGYRFYDPVAGRWLNRDPIGERGGLNSYRFITNKSVCAIDYLGLYQEGGHFYTAFMVSRAAGYSDQEAYEYASYTQYPDEDPQFDAINNALKAMTVLPGGGDARDIHDYLHSLLRDGSKGANNTRRCCLLKLLSSAGLEPWEKGFLTHALGDTYSHAWNDRRKNVWSEEVYRPEEDYPYTAGAGHGLDLTHPDAVRYRKARYKAYADALFQALGGKDRDSSQQMNDLSDFVDGLDVNGGDPKENDAFEKHARDKHGYDHDYAPQHAEKPNEQFPKKTMDDWKKLLEKIKAACKR